MYRKAYNKLFWGFIIILIDIHLGVINILPDVVGFILVYTSLGELLTQHIYYRKAVRFAGIEILLSVTDIIKYGDMTNGLIVNSTFIILNGISILAAIINLFLVYYICSAIMELSREKGDTDFAKTAKLTWTTYLIINYCFIVFRTFIINLTQNAINLVFIPSGIIVLIAGIVLINLIRNAGKSLS